MLSIVVPAIRQDRWINMYQSIQCSMPWELVIVSPYDLPPELNKPNVKHVKDFGSPIRASCIGAEHCTGKYFTWVADDGLVIKGTLDKVLAKLEGSNYKKVIVTKYLEGGNGPHDDSYYKLSNAYPKSPYIPDTWWIFNCAILHLEYYRYLGGWDCSYETCALGHADLAVRAQRDGAEVELIQEPLLDCTHDGALGGEHAPVYYGHVEHDQQFYEEMYRCERCVGRTIIDINNWKQAPAVWSRRFS